MRLQNLQGKKILILGFGREGRETLRFLLAKSPNIYLGIADKERCVKFQAPKLKIQNAKCKITIQNSKFIKLNTKQRINLHLGTNYLRSIRQYDLIIKSPGIPPKVIAPYITKNQKVTSATEIFLENCPGTVIGVTGTKGKSTTSAMICHILKKAGLKAHLVGNIGKPALSQLLPLSKKDIFVYELSSHQLYGLKKSPHIAVFLNIFPEHLDYYRNFQEYARAKANICRWQNKDGHLIYNANDKLVAGFVKKSKAKKIPIRGEYYELDRAAALAVAKILKIPKQSAIAALNNFNYLPHRLEKVGVFRGIAFYNDSLATIPQATIKALDFLGNRVETLIAGGYDRGVPFDDLAEKIIKSDVITLILFPSSGKRILKAIKKITNYKLQITNKSQTTKKSQITNYKLQTSKKQVAFFLASNMEDAVRIAFRHTQKGKICLLSPASPSFGLFKDYKDRGEQFRYWIKHM